MSTDSDHTLTGPVQDALTHIEEWLHTKPQLLSSSGETMTVRIDIGHLVSDTQADAVESFIHHDWVLQDLNMEQQTITVYGQASETPYLE